MNGSDKKHIEQQKDNGQLALTPILLGKDDAAYKTVEDIASQLEKGEALNIAVTGPYGSGKSSVLRTLKEKFTDYQYLDISLATLHQYEEEKQENERDVDKYDINQRIEYSILQQLIYKESPSVLRYSRLKRITGLSSREISVITVSTIVAMLCGIIIWEPMCLRVEWLYNLLSIKWLNYIGDVLSMLYLMLFAYKILHFTVSKIGEMKLSKVAVQNAEIELNDGKNSIFNRYLDEILYFFEQTPYNVVLIEDLDRFGTNEIYLKLRELNNILNESKTVGGKRKIFFVYAVRDDMFRDDERTKCFDYITTVLPVINRSNSQDMLRKELQRAGITKDDISDEDVEEIAFFLDDMRLLRNIVNEFIQYKEKLKAGLSLTKLLAMIVYKNYSPRDFADLHKSKGDVYECIASRNYFVEQREKELETQIEAIQEDNARRREVAILNERELREVYLYHIISGWQAFLGKIYFNGKSYALQDLIADENIFMLFARQTQIEYNYTNYYYNETKQKYILNFKEIENEINPHYTYQERLDVIKNKFAPSISKIETLEQEKREIRSLPLSQILKNIRRDDCERYRKLRLSPRVEFFLIKGYIGEDYYDYISYFYKDGIGLNEHDWQFVRDVKLDNPHDYTYHIDNVEACAKRLPSLYLNNKSILNVQLLDYFSSMSNESHKEDTITFLTTVVREKAWNFLCKYYKYGQNADVVFQTFFGLKENGDWNKYFGADTSLDDAMFVIWIKYAENKYSCDESQKWIANNFDFMISHGSEIGMYILKKLMENYEYAFTTLNEKNEELLKSVVDANAFQLTKENVTIIVDTLLKKVDNDDHSLSLTTIYQTENESLESYITHNLSICIKEIFSEPSSKKEDVDSIVQILEADNVTNEDKREYLKGQQQTISLDLLTDDTNKKMAIELLLVTPKWSEVQSYISMNGNKITDELNGFISLKYKELCADKIPDDDVDLFDTIFMNNELSISAYKELLHKFKDYYVFDDGELHGIEDERMELLINEGVFDYTKENTELLIEHYSDDILILYLEKYKNNALSEIGILKLNGKVITGLMLSSELTSEDKTRLALHVKDLYIKESKELANKVLHYLLSGEIYNTSIEFTNNLISYTDVIKERIAFVCKYIENKDSISTEEIAGVVTALGEPYNDLVISGKKPKVPFEAKPLVEILQGKGFVSSFKSKDDGIKVYTKNIIG